tara:strand:- start:5 stop:604 length:600 start_codon:yes stop_codon:yes gene_type:complete
MANINSFFGGKPKTKVRTPSCPAKRKYTESIDYDTDEAAALALLESTSEEDLYEESEYEFLWDVPEPDENTGFSSYSQQYKYEKEHQKKMLEQRLEKEEKIKYRKHKRVTIKRWTNAGMKFNNDEEEYYDMIINKNNCICCSKIFSTRKDRNLDHCHYCGIPRGIICFKCNINDRLECLFCPLSQFMKTIKKLNDSSRC